MTTSNTFCLLPQCSINIHATGKIVRCQMSEEPMGDLNDSEEIIDQWNNQKFIQLRKDQQSDIWQKGCWNCERKEQNNIKSKRLHWHNLDVVKEIWEEDNLYDVNRSEIWHLDIAFNNICNFKCRMCSSAYSNSWITDEKKLAEVGVPGGSGGAFKKQSVRQNRSKNTISTKQIENLLKNCEKLKRVEILGGEPFLADEFVNFLNLLRSKKLHKQVELQITTNGSVLTLEKLNLLKGFKYVNINFSLDSVGPLFEYMRSAGVVTWEHIKEKLLLVKTWCDNQNDGNTYKMNLNGAFQIYNSLNLYDFIEFIVKLYEWDKIKPSEFSSKNRHSFEHRCLVGPEFLSAMYLPEEIAKKSLSQLNDLLNKYFFLNNINETVYFKNIEKILTNSKNTQNFIKIHSFAKYTKELDTIRQQSIKDYAPELYNYYQQFYKTKEVHSVFLDQFYDDQKIKQVEKQNKMIEDRIKERQEVNKKLYDKLWKANAWERFNLEHTQLIESKNENYEDAIEIIRCKKIGKEHAINLPINTDIYNILLMYGRV